MVEQKILSARSVERMSRQLKNTNDHSPYTTDTYPGELEFPKGGSGIWVNEDFALEMPGGSDMKDLVNTKTVFSALKDLTPAQASDKRLWTYLTHVTFWDYMKRRWPLAGADNPVGRIRDRYFLNTTSLESLTRNGIARLWWYGYLTYDEGRSNPWGLTEVLLSRADLVVGITERVIGANYTIRTALLEFFAENPAYVKDEDLRRAFLRKLNLAGGIRSFPFMDGSDLRTLFGRLAQAA